MMPARYDRCVRKVAAKGTAKNAHAVCAAAVLHKGKGGGKGGGSKGKKK
jgi:hypothetical protein